MIRIAAFYRFTRFADPAALRGPLLELARAAGVRGTILLAGEGINATIAGPAAGIDRVLAHVRGLSGCGGLEVKFAEAAAMPFHRLKVRLKREIVTMGEPAADPMAGTGTYVDPADWNAVVDDPDTVLIDTRNDYEIAVGSFAGALDPATRHFADFPAWFRAHRATLEGKRVAMFCTGGIRCEKATALLRQEGIADVAHLRGGILRYLEDVPAADSRWQGECFVFDERVAVAQGLSPGSHVLCRGCRMPVGAEDRASADYVEGVSCPRCHGSRDAVQRRRYAERHRQAGLAAERGQNHVGDASADRG